MKTRSWRLRTKMMMMMILITILPALTSGLLALLIYNNTLKQQAVTSHVHEVKNLRTAIESLLMATKNDLSFLTQSAPLLDYLSTQMALVAANRQNQSDDTLPPGGATVAARPALQKVLERQWQTLEQEFLSFSRYHSLYYQVTYLDETGQEVVQIVADGLRIKTVERDQLQNRATQDYFKQTMLLSGKQLFVSPVHLFREQQIEMPLKAVIEYAANVYYNNERKAGVIVLTVDANQLLRMLENGSRLVNQEGFFLAHPDPKKCWGGPADLNHKYTLVQEYPALANLMLRQEGIFETGEVTLFSSVIALAGTSQHWTLIISRPTHEVFKEFWWFRLIFSGILVITVVIMLLVAWWFTRRVTRPLEQLVRIADVVSKGDKLDKRLDIDASGEIEELIQSFDRMRISLLKSFEKLRHPQG